MVTPAAEKKSRLPCLMAPATGFDSLNSGYFFGSDLES
jgi:hypothetical protein